MQSTLWFLIKLDSLILTGQLSISMKSLSFHYVALSITKDFMLVNLTKINFESQIEQRLLFLVSLFPRRRADGGLLLFIGLVEKRVGIKGKREREKKHYSLKSSPCCEEIF